MKYFCGKLSDSSGDLCHPMYIKAGTIKEANLKFSSYAAIEGDLTIIDIKETTAEALKFLKIEPAELPEGEIVVSKYGWVKEIHD